MYVLVLHHPNYKSKYVSNPVVVGESTDEHALPSCPQTRRILLASGGEVDNWSHNHQMEITDPLRASAGGVTLNSSSHNSTTSNAHVPVTVGSSIRRPRMIATSCNVIVISPTGT